MYPQEWLAEPDGDNLTHQKYRYEKIANRAEYLLEKKRGGKFLYTNFPSIRETCIRPHKDDELIRPQLGDYEHVASAALRVFSSLYLSPLFAYEFYRLGKTIGHCTIAGLAETLSTELAQEKGLLDVQRMCWEKTGIVYIKDIEIDAKNRWIRYTINRNIQNITAVGDGQQHMMLIKPCCYLEIGILCGQTEALMGGVWDGVEIGCYGEENRSLGIELHEKESRATPRITQLTKEEYCGLLDRSIDLATNNRTNIDSYQMISLSQSVNYLLLSASRGHVVLSKWAGKKVGERIIKKTKANNLFDTLDYLKKLFLELRIGIMEYKADFDSIRIRIMESVYSSGVNNIHMKLCIFLAGIIEGGINEAVKTSGGLNDEPEWVVLETKCTAKGDHYCEFNCYHRDQEKLRNMLVG